MRDAAHAFAGFPRAGMMEKALDQGSSMERLSAETAFLAAFDEYADALFRHAALRIASRERATDLAQETFLRAWDYVRGGGKVRHWKSFLYRVLHNLIVDEYRKAREESLDALLEEETADARVLSALSAGSRAEKEESLDTELLVGRVRELMRRLPEGERVVITMRYVDGFAPKEIAGLLGITENATSVRIHRAVARLKGWCASFESS